VIAHDHFASALTHSRVGPAPVHGRGTGSATQLQGRCHVAGRWRPSPAIEGGQGEGAMVGSSETVQGATSVTDDQWAPGLEEEYATGERVLMVGSTPPRENTKRQKFILESREYGSAKFGLPYGSKVIRASPAIPFKLILKISIFSIMNKKNSRPMVPNTLPKQPTLVVKCRKPLPHSQQAKSRTIPRQNQLTHTSLRASYYPTWQIQRSLVCLRDIGMEMVHVSRHPSRVPGSTPIACLLL
jgi:hypothetical protein